jgi:hypothetical protein
VNLSTYLRFLFGQRQAILDAAGTRGLLGLGLLFVLSAGLAREYDAEDLLHEPWHVLLPLGASVVGSLVLFFMIRGIVHRDGIERPYWRGYLVFLGLYWLTAPLAWLYAIPFERFFTPLEAVKANVGLLAIVSVWRVLLITRVASVWLGATFLGTLMPVMLFADTLVVLLLGYTALPRVMIAMGGLRLEAIDQWIGGLAASVGLMTFWGWPFWAVATAVTAAQARWSPPVVPAGLRVGRGLWGLAGAALIVGAIGMLWAQPEQRLRSRTERLLEQGELPEAIALMSAHEPGDYPPHWNPPPRYGELLRHPSAVDMLWTITREPTSADWVRALYRDKFRVELDGMTTANGFGRLKGSDRTDRLLDLLEGLPDGKELVRERAESLREQAAGLSPERRERIHQMLVNAGVPIVDPRDRREHR